MSIMTTVYRRGLKRCLIDEEVDILSPKKIKRFQDNHQEQKAKPLTYRWSLKYKNQVNQTTTDKKNGLEAEYYCQVYLKLYPKTCKCTLDVVVKSTSDILDDTDLILLAKTRTAKVIKPGTISN